MCSSYTRAENSFEPQNRLLHGLRNYLLIALYYN